MEGIIEFDKRFSTLLKPDASLVRLATGAIWSEGPVYFHEDDSVIWSDIPNNRLLRWSSPGWDDSLAPALQFRKWTLSRFRGTTTELRARWSLPQPNRTRRAESDPGGSLSGEALKFTK